MKIKGKNVRLCFEPGLQQLFDAILLECKTRQV